MSKQNTKIDEVIPESPELDSGDIRDPEMMFACADCGLHYRTKNLADACEEACKAGACDAEITAQAVERGGDADAVVEAPTNPSQNSEAPHPSSRTCCGTQSETDFEAMWKRALADYQNLAKEMSAERVRMRKDALRDVVTQLLPILDNFSAALEHAPDMSSQNSEAPHPSSRTCCGTQLKQIKGWITGVGFIRKQMEDMLSEFGVTRIETVGKPFDAKTMEAVGEEPADAEALAGKDAPESGTVLRETMAGYKLGETIIRPAKVITVK